jgi:hypothetical protein
MKKVRSKQVIPLLCAACLLGASSLATAGCGTINTGLTCPDPNTQFILTNPPDPGNEGGTGTGGSGSCEIECPYIWTPPPEPTLDCVREGMEYFCNAWPQGPTLTYRWSHDASVSLEFGTPTQLPQQRISCFVIGGMARVQLVIETPSMLQSRRTFQFSCDLHSSAPPAPGGEAPAPGTPPAEEMQ